MDDGRPRTLEEVGKELSNTERIRQIEAKALRNSVPLRSKALKDIWTDRKTQVGSHESGGIPSMPPDFLIICRQNGIRDTGLV
jgi:hypothetical protein